jgi:hypothetical protein
MCAPSPNTHAECSYIPVYPCACWLPGVHTVQLEPTSQLCDPQGRWEGVTLLVLGLRVDLAEVGEAGAKCQHI